MSNNDKTITIIGGGIAGLATGCYAQMNGYQCVIYEMHEKPGGCCTSWERRDYTFDWCISWLYGSGSGNEMAQIWDELGALRGKQIRNFEIFNTVVSPTGERLDFYSDPDQLEAHFLKIAPEDAKLIKEFCQFIRSFKKCVPYYPFAKTQGLMSFWEKCKLIYRMLPYIPLFMKTSGTKMEDYSREFKNPLLRESLNYIFYERLETFPIMPYCFTLASSAANNCGVPDGGSLALAQSLEKRFRQLGGRIHYFTKVDEILVDSDKAVGCRLSDGTEVRSDYVIGACDGVTVIYKMLKGKYVSSFLQGAYKKLQEAPDETIFPGVVTVYFAVNKDYSHVQPFTTFLLTDAQRQSFRGMLHPAISVQLRSALYPTHAPKGKSILYVTYLSSYDAWEELSPADLKQSASKTYRRHTSRRRTPQYRQAKKALRQQLIEFLGEHYEGLAENVEHTDISTPLTSVRYTGNYRGSILAWMPFSDHNEQLEKEINKHGYELPGLKNFYLAGQWMVSGCVTRAAASGRHVVQYLCREDKRTFQVVKEEEGERESFAAIESLLDREIA